MKKDTAERPGLGVCAPGLRAPAFPPCSRAVLAGIRTRTPDARTDGGQLGMLMSSSSSTTVANIIEYLLWTMQFLRESH